MLTESRQIQSRWKEHIEDLYDKSSKPSGDEMKPTNVGEDSVRPDHHHHHHRHHHHQLTFLEWPK